MDTINRLSRSIRIWILIICVSISLILISNITAINKDKGVGFGNGLDYGIDFAGGIQMWLKLENPVTSDVMAIEKGILENRLNAMGLKDIPIYPYGDQFILIKIAKASPEEIKVIEGILKKQARFEQRIDGELAVKGDEISVDLSTEGSGAYPVGNGFGWYVNVKLNPDAACRFGRVAQGKFFGEDNPRNRPVDLFIDRPENTTILMSGGLHGILGNTTFVPGQQREDIYFGDTALEVIENRSRIPIIVLDENDINKTLSEFRNYKDKGFTKTIIAEDEIKIPDKIRNMIEDLGIDTQRMEIGNKSPDSWIKEVTGLKTTPRLNFDTRGECVYNARITGSAATKEEADAEIKQNQIWLTSGNLPEKASIESKSTVPPSLGAQFLRYCFITGIIAIITVSIVIFLRYRKLFIVIPVIITGLSEIIIILGLASLINWEIDLPAIAGIIAAVGTGVDDQIVITDETIERGIKKRRVISLIERIRRAFFIIFTAAATTIAVMLPLMTFVAGMLRGFAFTTMAGVLIGVFITRPAYAKIIEEILKG